MKQATQLLEDDVVVQVDADVELEDVDEEPTRMERLYRREDNDGRGIHALAAVRCPVCGRITDWPNNRNRPFCLHDPDQGRWRTREPWGGW